MNRRQFFLTIIAAIGLTLIVFWKLPLKGQVPFPGHLLAGRFFPWNTMDWSAYPNGVPYKEFISADTIRQTYPWRILAIDQLKSGHLPWWNPYNFSGSPLLANLQSAPFYPLNFIYWFTTNQTAWIIQVLSQPILAIIFTYLFTRTLGRSHLAAIFSGFTFAFSGFMLVWSQLNTVAHAGLWLPLILFSLSKAQTNSRYYLLAIIGLSSSFFAGHAQTSIYVWLFSLAYAFLINHQLSGRHLKSAILKLTTTFGIALAAISIQLFPALELLSLSPRSLPSREIFDQFLMPFGNLVTFLAPNYFGNPATNNFFGADYGEFMAFFGTIAITLALSAVLTPSKSKIQKFFTISFLVSLLFATKNPIAYLPFSLNLPLFNNSAAARILFLTQFSGSILAAFGLDQFIKRPKTILKALAIIIVIFTFLWLFTSFSWLTTTDALIKINRTTSLRNLFFPSAIFGLFSFFVFARIFLPRFKPYYHYLFYPIFIGLPLINTTIFATKYLPFSEPKFMFPETPIFTKLQTYPDHYRFFGDYTAAVTSNTWLPYRVYGVEGYDSLYIKRYGEFLAASANAGQIPEPIPRSDANLEKNADQHYRQRAQDLLGVRHILDKNDNPQWNWEPEPLRFPEDRYQLDWQQGKFKIYHNSEALPRALVVPTYQVISDPQAILDRLYSPDFDPTKVVILESSPESLTTPDFTPREYNSVNLEELTATGSATITTYQPNQLTITTQSTSHQFLLLSDNFYPGWQATIDGNTTTVMRANYTFRAVLIPPGAHTITFTYQYSPFN